MARSINSLAFLFDVCAEPTIASNFSVVLSILEADGTGLTGLGFFLSKEEHPTNAIHRNKGRYLTLIYYHILIICQINSKNTGVLYKGILPLFVKSQTFSISPIFFPLFFPSVNIAVKS